MDDFFIIGMFHGTVRNLLTFKKKKAIKKIEHMTIVFITQATPTIISKWKSEVWK